MASPFNALDSRVGFGTTGSVGNPAPSTPRPATRRGGLLGPLDEFFIPEFERLQGSQEDLEQRFLDALASPVDFESFRGELEALGSNVAGELFAPGGQVEQATGEALRADVTAGRGTRSGSFNRSRLGILEGASDQVSNVIGRAAPQLAATAAQSRATDLANLFGFTELQSGRLENLRESLFAGEASEFQRGQSEEVLDLNRLMVEQALRERGGGGFGDRFGGAAGGALQGAAIGSAIPGLGTGIGAGIGALAGLFG